MGKTDATQRPRRRRADGERSRQAILDAAARLITVEGLEGLSIARLAEHSGMSKSGLYAHFGSKEELQLATLETADEIFDAEVVTPAEENPPGFGRLESLCEAFLSHVERSVFPGGCFLASAAAELDTHPGPVKDRLEELHRSWLGTLKQEVLAAKEQAEIRAEEDADQLVFELDAYLGLGNALFLLYGESLQIDRARRAIRDRLERARSNGGS